MYHGPADKQAMMITFRLPADWPAALLEVIPEQRAQVHKLLAEGVIQSYSVSADRQTVWMVVVVDDQDGSVDELLADFPIMRFARVRWQPLLFTSDSSSVMHYSLN